MTRDPQSLPPKGTSVWILGSGKSGHEVQSLGIARALGIEPSIKPVRPRLLYRALAPWGPADPRDAAQWAAPPFPDIAIAGGRATIPGLRALKRASGGRVFTICLQDPRAGTSAADLIWVPEHDRLRGENVVVTLTSPHGLSAAVLAQARASPDPRIAALQAPRAALVLGGPSAHHRYEARDLNALARIACDIAASGHSLMVTPSRRTPPQAVGMITDALALIGAGPDRAFVWDGAGANPYAQMLAHAEAIVVTADSANMLGEALAPGVPVHVYEPSGGHPKMTAFLERLIGEGCARRWRGALETWPCIPLDATGEIAAAVARRYAAFRRG